MSRRLMCRDLTAKLGTDGSAASGNQDRLALEHREYFVVIDKDFSDETNIRIRFNDLYRQFMNNEKYILNPMGEEGMLPEDEDIFNNINVENKRYSRSFYQVSKGEGISDSVDKAVWFMIAMPEYREVYRDKFLIVIYYDNKRNVAQGEDL